MSAQLRSSTLVVWLVAVMHTVGAFVSSLARGGYSVRCRWPSPPLAASPNNIDPQRGSGSRSVVQAAARAEAGAEAEAGAGAGAGAGVGVRW